MKIIYEGDSFVQSILGTKQLAADTPYRPSSFVMCHEVDGKRYLYNNFTKKVWLLEDESFDLSEGARFSPETIENDSALRQLVKDSFLVPVGKDETATYESFCKIARAMKMKKNGYSTYTILPTTACNARCVYCYEEGIEFVTMTEDTVNQVIAFIKKTRNPNDKVNFSWFGGEPLIGEKMIDKICAAMREADIPYRSRITTNGSLITEKNVKKMRDDWHLQHVQITLDGVEEEYNRRKNYYFNYDSAYWHVLSHIKLVNENEITLNIRVNVDAGNIDGVPQMVEDLKNFVPNPELLSMDIAPLFDLQASESGLEIWDKSFRLAEWLREQQIHIAAHYSSRKARYNFCMADSPYRAIVIAPDGKLYNCENIMSFDSVGDIWEGITNEDYIKGLFAVEPAREQCKGCFSLPECTTFSRCGHPRVDCKYAARKRAERAVTALIRHCIAQQKQEEEPETEETEVNSDNC